MNSIQKGFTLIELMIVVAITGILAAIAIPAYQDYIARSQMSEALSLASGLKTSVAEGFAQDGKCPTNGTAGIADATAINGKYVKQVVAGGTGTATGGCTIEATMQAANVSTGIQNKTLTLTLGTAAAGGSVSWGCKSSAEDKYLPKVCQKS